MLLAVDDLPTRPLLSGVLRRRRRHRVGTVLAGVLVTVFTGAAALGGNIQVITVPDGWPIWTSGVRPGREHDTTALRTHTEILPALPAADLRTVGDLGYEGESDTITVAFNLVPEPPKPSPLNTPNESASPFSLSTKPHPRPRPTRSTADVPRPPTRGGQATV
jgi:hypothetical protein